MNCAKILPQAHNYVVLRIKQVCGLNKARVASFGIFELHLGYRIAIWGGIYSTNLEESWFSSVEYQQYQNSCQESFLQLKVLTSLSLYILEC